MTEIVNKTILEHARNKRNHMVTPFMRICVAYTSKIVIWDALTYLVVRIYNLHRCRIFQS